MAHGGSQARGQIRAVGAGLSLSNWDLRSKLKFTATPDP